VHQFGETSNQKGKWLNAKPLRMNYCIEHIVVVNQKIIIGDAKGYIKLADSQDCKLIKDLGTVFINELIVDHIPFGGISDILTLSEHSKNQIWVFGTMGVIKQISISMYGVIEKIENETKFGYPIKVLFVKNDLVICNAIKILIVNIRNKKLSQIVKIPNLNAAIKGAEVVSGKLFVMDLSGNVSVRELGSYGEIKFVRSFLSSKAATLVKY
jgi:hypothetical protein